MPLYGIFILLNSDGLLSMYYRRDLPGDELGYVNRIYLVFFVTTVLMPCLSFFILKRNRFVSSYSMPHRKERFVPYATTLIYYFGLYYLLKAGNFPDILLSACFGIIVVMSIVIFVNSLIKISAHAVGIAGVIAMYAVMVKQDWIKGNDDFLALLIVIAGLIGTARLSLNAHRNSEVYLGILVGFAGQFMIMNFKIFI